MSEKKRVNVMIYDRWTQPVLDLAKVLNSTPNEVVNRFVEGCMNQIDQRRKPIDPIPVVDLARTILRRNLSAGDRMLQNFLDDKIDGWKEETQMWRDFVLEEANSTEEELTSKVLADIKKRADKRVRASQA